MEMKYSLLLEYKKNIIIVLSRKTNCYTNT